MLVLEGYGTGAFFAGSASLATLQVKSEVQEAPRDVAVDSAQGKAAECRE